MPTLRLVVTGVALALAMAVSGWIGHRDWRGSVALLLTSVVWLTADRGFEGPTLVVVDSSHGLVLADVLGLAGFAVGLWQLVCFRRRR